MDIKTCAAIIAEGLTDPRNDDLKRDLLEFSKNGEHSLLALQQKYPHYNFVDMFVDQGLKKPQKQEVKAPTPVKPLTKELARELSKKAREAWLDVLQNKLSDIIEQACGQGECVVEVPLDELGINVTPADAEELMKTRFKSFTWTIIDDDENGIQGVTISWGYETDEEVEGEGDPEEDPERIPVDEGMEDERLETKEDK